MDQNIDSFFEGDYVVSVAVTFEGAETNSLLYYYYCTHLLNNNNKFGKKSMYLCLIFTLQFKSVHDTIFVSH